MREVAILGVGQTPVREHWDISLRALAAQAARAALADAAWWGRPYGAAHRRALRGLYARPDWLGRPERNRSEAAGRRAQSAALL